jgi:hypothetical protein
MSRAFGIGVMSGALLIAIAGGYAIRKYPDAASRAGGVQVALLCLAVLAYLVGGWWARSIRDARAKASLGIGAAIDMLLGLIGAVNITVENFVSLPGPLAAIVPATAMAFMVIAFALGAILAMRRSGSIALALLASIWAAVVGMVITCAYGFVLNLATIASSLVVANTISSASTHMLVAPVVALSVGTVAILAARISWSLGRRATFMLALIELALFVLGVTALVFAASLQRQERPPFVMSGMLATALALTCLPALALKRLHSR